MKKISRNDLQGQRRQFPVLSKDAMKNYVGGYNGGYTGDGIGLGGTIYEKWTWSETITVN